MGNRSLADLATDSSQAHLMDANLLDLARQQYPVLNNSDIGYTDNPRRGNRTLEYWPKGEPGPQSLPIGKPGLEVYRTDTRPIDILGDVVSHGLIDTDPKVRGYYDQFQKSLTPSQGRILQEQYAHARNNEGERRPFDQWMTSTGLPSYFRGYAFQQWPQEGMEKYYTPGQFKMFDEMMQYLSSDGGY
jgi:hypothetical protein